MTLADLREYTTRRRQPTRIEHDDYTIYGMGPSSSGGLTVGETLNILDALPVSATDRTRALHLFLEASRLAFADRNAYIADPSFFDVPVRGLLSTGFAAQRAALVPQTRAGTSPAAPGNPYAFQPGNGTGAQASATVARSGSTTHLVTADRAGNVVSYTFTIESTGGNGIVVPGHGFLLNNELTDFNYDSTTHPNRPEGRKRPRSSMSPTIVLRDGRPFLAVGSPGGATIITTVAQVLLERLDLGRSLPAAVAAPRASQRNTTSTTAEPAFIASPEGQALATTYGHRFTSMAEIGAVTALELRGRRRVLAVAEPTRRGGGAAGTVRRAR